MQKALFYFAGLILMLGTVGCEYSYAPMTAKDMAENPLKPLPADFRARIWLKLEPTYSRTDAHYSRWDFYVPQGWKEGYITENHSVGGYTYEWRCDVNITFLHPKHQDEQRRYTFVYKNGEYVPEEMSGEEPRDLLAPTSALPYTPYDVTLNQVAALSAIVPDKTWTVDNQMPDLIPMPHVRALYFMHGEKGGYDSAVYLVEKLAAFNGWKYIDDPKIPVAIGESPVYYIYAYKGPGAWPTFNKDVMAALFPETAADPGKRIGERN